MRNPQFIDRPCVLIAGESAIVSMAISEDLEAQGYRVVGPYYRCSDAMNWLANQTPDIAIIDVQLPDGSCAELAATLSERGTPFVVHTAWGCRNRPSEFRDAPCIDQPNSSKTLIATMKDLLERRLRAHAAFGERTGTSGFERLPTFSDCSVHSPRSALRAFRMTATSIAS